MPRKVTVDGKNCTVRCRTCRCWFGKLHLCKTRGNKIHQRQAYSIYLLHPHSRLEAIEASLSNPFCSVNFCFYFGHMQSPVEWLASCQHSGFSQGANNTYRDSLYQIWTVAALRTRALNTQKVSSKSMAATSSPQNSLIFTINFGERLA